MSKSFSIRVGIMELFEMDSLIEIISFSLENTIEIQEITEQF